MCNKLAFFVYLIMYTQLTSKHYDQIHQVHKKLYTVFTATYLMGFIKRPMDDSIKIFKKIGKNFYGWDLNEETLREYLKERVKTR